MDKVTELTELSQASYARGNFREAVTIARQAMRLLETAPSADRRLEPHIELSMALGNALCAMGAPDHAEPFLREALVLATIALAVDHPSRLRALCALATVFEARGQLDEAQRHYAEVLRLLDGHEPPDCEQLAAICNKLARLARARGELAQAIQLAQRAVLLRKTLLGEHHPWLGTDVVALAGLLESQGNVDEAATHYEYALAIFERHPRMCHHQLGRTCSQLAFVRIMQGRYQAAALLYKRAVAVLETFLGTSHPEVALALNDLAVLEADLGLMAAARGHAARAVRIATASLGNDHPHVATLQANYAAYCRHDPDQTLLLAV